MGKPTDPERAGDPEEGRWLASQRGGVERYLAGQGAIHGGVAEDPEWTIPQRVAVWAVRSMADPDRVGWWAISGDVPADYMSCRGERDVGDVLLAFAARWTLAAEQMAAGGTPDGFTVGDPANARELAPLLASRAKLLHDFGVHEKFNDVERALAEREINAQRQGAGRLVISRQVGPVWPTPGNSFWIGVLGGDWHICTWGPYYYRLPPSASILDAAETFMRDATSAQMKMPDDILRKFGIAEVDHEEFDRKWKGEWETT
jgi:hypothetical protein